ncbi:MAG: DUF11 domain-containing protein [Chloroflexi bacterium]|nr:DUF11 domain-containing protein [Chloroflexota bacterium]
MIKRLEQMIFFAFGLVAIAVVFLIFTQTITAAPTAVDLSIQKGGQKFMHYPGGVIYVITYTNGGTNDSQEIIVTDTFPSGLFWSADSSGFAPLQPMASDFVAWKFPPLAVGASRSFTLTSAFSGPLTFGQILTNTVTIQPDPGEVITDNNTAKWPERVCYVWDLNDSGLVDAVDVGLAAGIYHSVQHFIPGELYRRDADLNSPPNFKIDIQDIMIIASRMGISCTPP